MKLYCQILYKTLILADTKIPFKDKLNVVIEWLIASSIISMIISYFQDWFINHEKFVVYFIVCVFANAFFGIWKHIKERDFDFLQFLKKTAEMLIVVVAIYGLLYMVADLSDDNLLVEIFKTAIQIMTLMFPVSKAVRSIYIISNGKYPPAWIMEKVYAYEKNGNIKELFKQNEDE